MEKNNSRKQISIGILLSYVTIIVGIFTGLLYTPWMLSILGESEYGMYTIANSTISIFLMDFGLSTAVTRYMAKYNELKDIEAMESFYATVNKLYLFVDIAIVVCLAGYYFLIPELYKALTPIEIEKLRMIFIILGVYSVISFFYIPSDGILTAHERFIASRACTLCTKVLTVALTVLFLLLGYGLIALVIVHVACGFLSVVFKKIYIVRCLKLRPLNHVKSHVNYRELGVFTGWITVIKIGNRLALSIIPTLLGIVSGSYEVTIFGLAATLEAFVFSIASTANTVLFPRISNAYNSDTPEKTNSQRLLIKIGKYQLFICGVIFCGFFSIGKPFVEIWTHGNYESLYFTTLLLLIPVFIEQIQGAVGLTMQVSGKLKEIALAQIAVGILNIVLVLSVGGRYGALGAAGSLFIAKACKLIYQCFIFNKLGKINMANFYRNVFSPFALPIIFSIGVGFGLDYLLAISNMWELVLSAVGITVAFSLLCSFCVLSKEDRTKAFAYIIAFFARK